MKERPRDESDHQLSVEPLAVGELDGPVRIAGDDQPETHSVLCDDQPETQCSVLCYDQPETQCSVLCDDQPAAQCSVLCDDQPETQSIV